jgi:hypothetical protein
MRRWLVERFFAWISPWNTRCDRKEGIVTAGALTI